MGYGRRIMITGGFGFIGTNLVKYWREKYPADEIVVLDAITYAADPKPVRSEKDDHIRECMVDIRDQAMVARALQQYVPDVLFHLAAESHVCRSIAGPKDFVTTNIVGTWNLLEEWRQLWASDPQHPFIHISTDEVFGQLQDEDQPWTENSAVTPRSPYAASKAASDLLALSYFETYAMPVIVTNCSNNFGRFQHEEKLIPASIKRMLAGKPPVIFGDGTQIRDWLFVEDHCWALDVILREGKFGERYCIGGDQERTNMEMVQLIHQMLQDSRSVSPGVFHVEHSPNARPTDDRRYAINSDKLKRLGWSPCENFEMNLARTVQWFVLEESRR